MRCFNDLFLIKNTTPHLKEIEMQSDQVQKHQFCDVEQPSDDILRLHYYRKEIIFAKSHKKGLDLGWKINKGLFKHQVHGS